MPYTAPLQLSPPEDRPQNLTSHHHTRNSASEPVTTPSGRPRLPHSYSSTSYVRRHRRSPSVSKSVVLPVVEASSAETSQSHDGVDPHTSLRQSPPPLNNAPIPPGAVISPPESGTNSSDDEETTGRKRGEPSLAGLEAAIRSIQKQRETSPGEPTPVEVGEIASSSSEVSPLTSTAPEEHARIPLSVQARKISHSRSSTETSILKPQTASPSPNSSPDDSDSDEETELSEKPPPMVRKKSGELVRPALRPASVKRRPSSMPGTPTFSKAVHFDAQLEHIRHFLQLDKPLAVSAETSPVEAYADDSEFPFGNEGSVSASKVTDFEWELRLANFPKDLSSRQHLPVHLERIFLSSDNKNLVGVVAVANIAFHKHVVARFTLDYWKTVSEVTAEYNHDVRRKQAHDGYDRFNFNVKLADQANLETKTMFICIRYTVHGQEFWDNNSSMNYQVDFVKKPKVRAEKHSVPGVGTPGVGTRPALPRSRYPPVSNAARPRSMPPSFWDLESAIDSDHPFDRPDNSARTDSPLRSSTTASRDFVPEAPKRKNNPARQAFGNRYDFGVSLSAAMQTKNTTQDRTVLSARATKSETESYSTSKQNEPVREESRPLTSKATPLTGPSNERAHSESLKPSSIVSSKPHHESSIYKELVDKYCFYGSPKSPFSTTKQVVGQSDSERTPDGGSSPEKESPSASVSPPSPSYRENTSHVDSAAATSSRPRMSRSQSSSATHLNSHASSPLAFGFPYHQSMQNSFFSESNAPTAIQG